MKNLRLRPAAALLVLAATLLTGCSGSVSVGSPKAIKAADLADSIASRITGEGSDSLEVTCEDDLPAKVDATVDCLGTDPEGHSTGFRPVVTAVDGDDVEYDSPLFLTGEELAGQVQASLEEQGYVITSSECEEVAGEVGATSTCTVVDDSGTEQDLDVTVNGLDGILFNIGYTTAS